MIYFSLRTHFDSFFRPRRLLYLTAPEPSSPPDPDPVPPAPSAPAPAETPPVAPPVVNNEAWPTDIFAPSAAPNIVGQDITAIRDRIGLALEDPGRFGMFGLGYTPQNYNDAERNQRLQSAEGVSAETLTRLGGRVAGVQAVQGAALRQLFERVAEEERSPAERSRLRSAGRRGLTVGRAMGRAVGGNMGLSRAEELLRTYETPALRINMNPSLADRADRFSSNQVYRPQHYDSANLNMQLRTRYYLDPTVEGRAGAAAATRAAAPGATSANITEAVTIAITASDPNAVPLSTCIDDLLSSKERSDGNPDLLALKRLVVGYDEARASIRTLYERDPNRRQHALERDVTRETESVTALATLKTNFETLAAKRREEQTLTERINRQPLIERFKTFESYKTALDVMGPSYDEWIKENQACDGFQRDINLYGAPATGLIAVTQNQLNTERGRLLQRPATIASLTTQLTNYETKLVAAQQQFREAEMRRTAARSKLSLEAGKLQNLLVGVAPFAATLPAFPCNLRGILPPAFVAIICPPPPVPPAISTVTLDPTAHADILNLKQQVVTAQNTLRADPLFSAVSSTDIAAGDQDALRTELSTCQKEIRDAEAAMRTAAGTLTSNAVPAFAVAPTGGGGTTSTPAQFVNDIITQFTPPAVLPPSTDPFVIDRLAALSAQKRALDQRATTATTQRDRVAGPEDKKALKNLTAEQLLYFVVRDMMENGVTVAGQRITENSEYAVKLAVNLLHVDATTNSMRFANEKIARELGRTGVRGGIGRAWNHSRLNRRTMSFQDILASMSHIREYRALEQLARNPRSRPIILADVRQIVGKEKDGNIDRDLLTDLANNLEGVLSDQVTGVRIRDDHAIYLQNLIGLLRQVWAEKDAQDFSYAYQHRSILPASIAKDAQEGFVRRTDPEFILDLLEYQRFHSNQREKAMKEKFPNRPEWQTFLRRSELTKHLRDLRTQMKDKSPEDRKKLLDSHGITSIPAVISAIMGGKDLLSASGKFLLDKTRDNVPKAWEVAKKSPELIGDGARGLGRGLLGFGKGLGKLALWPYKTLFWTAPKAVAPHVARAGSSALNKAGNAVKFGGKVLLSPVLLPISLSSWLLRSIYESGLPHSQRLARQKARTKAKEAEEKATFEMRKKILEAKGQTAKVISLEAARKKREAKLAAANAVSSASANQKLAA